MRKFLKKVLSVLIVCSLVLTTSSIATLADGLNNETSKVVESTEISKTTKEIETTETTTKENLGESGSTNSYEEELKEDETTTVEEPEEDETTTVEEPEEDETTTVVDSSASSNEEESTIEETTVEESTTKELTLEESKNNQTLFGDGDDHTFTFITNEAYPEDFGWFDADHTINVITYHSNQLDTNPITIPLVYNVLATSTAWVDVGWLLYKGEGVQEEFLSDDQLNTLVTDWSNNPNEDVRVRVDFDQIYHSSLKHAPNKINYFVDEEIDPAGLVIEVSDQIFETDTPTWTKDIAYDAVQYSGLFSREILDEDKNSLGWDTVTADTKYCRFHFNNSVYEDVELNVRVPHTFKFAVPGPDDDPNPFGWFNSENGPRTIEYNSQDLDTNPVVVPVFYPAAWSGGWTDPDWINVGWINESDNNWISDDDLNTLITSWTANPSEDVTVRVNMSQIWNSTVKTPPTKTTYYVGDEFDPSGLVFEASDEISSPATWTKDIPYDEPQFQRLYSYQLLDESETVIAGNTITAETKYCKFVYNTRNEHNVELNVGYPPKKWTFRNTYGYFNGVETATEIEYLSNTLNTNPITIPMPYMTAYNGKFDLGWNDGTNDFTDAELQTKINDWTSNPQADVVITVNAYDQADAGTYIDASVNPTKTSYYVGESFAPAGLEFVAYDNGNTHTKTIRYNDVQYGRLFANNVTYLDSERNPITTTTMTLDTSYAAIRFNNSVYVVSEVSVSEQPPTPPTPPAPTPTPTPYYPSGGGGSSSGGGGSSPSVGPMGDLTKTPVYQQQLMQQGQINSTNNIPQTNLIVDASLAVTLLSMPDNANIPKSNIVDANGNAGFGKWAKAPGTASWYFLAGDLGANGTLGTAGFVSNGLYNLSWGTTSGWYSFDANGIMQTGWKQINGRQYYFEANPNDAEYGKASVGSKIIDGQVYNFDANGALIG